MGKITSNLANHCLNIKKTLGGTTTDWRDILC